VAPLHVAGSSVTFEDGFVGSAGGDGVADRLDTGSALAEGVVEAVLGAAAGGHDDPVCADVDSFVRLVDVEERDLLAVDALDEVVGDELDAGFVEA
jgi:hypothetical protein